MEPSVVLEIMRSNKSVDRAMEKVKIISLGNGKCLAELKVEEEHTNFQGGLHGGLVAIIVDNISTYALMTKLGAVNLSANLHIRHFKEARLHDHILIDANVVRTEKKLAYLEVEITNKDTRDLLIKGAQTKFLYNEMPSEITYKLY